MFPQLGLVVCHAKSSIIHSTNTFAHKVRRSVCKLSTPAAKQMFHLHSGNIVAWQLVVFVVYRYKRCAVCCEQTHFSPSVHTLNLHDSVIYLCIHLAAVSVKSSLLSVICSVRKCKDILPDIFRDWHFI